MQIPPKLFVKQYATPSACYEYRCWVPARGLQTLYGADVTRGGEWQLSGSQDFQQYLALLAHQDIVQYYASGGQATAAILKFLRTLKPWDYLGSKRYPPIYWTDLDDNVDHCHPLNFRFKVLGTRTLSGRYLKPGEEVRIVLTNGELITIWKDGEKGFNIANNIEANKTLNKCLKKADAVTFTTERLRRYYVDRYRLNNTYVFPNSVIFTDYPDIKIRKKTGVVRLLWQGGEAHYADWYPLKAPMARAMEKFPELELVVWGPWYPSVFEGLPRVEHHPWVPYDAYKLKLATMDFDIMIAPLVENKFNIYKSSIKMYEAAALPRPRPTLAGAVPPYSDDIIDGETGMLFKMPSKEDPDGDDFLTKLESLIRDAKLRQRIATNAKDWIRDNRSFDKTVPPLWDFLCATKERQERRWAT